MALQKTRVTIEEFEQFIVRADNLGKRFELINGEIVEKMPTELHSYIINMIAFFLTLYLQDHPIGYSLIEPRYQVPSSPENDLIPDLAFRVIERGPIRSSGAAPYMPDLVVEAQSEGRSDKFMADKAKIYLDNGARIVWIIYSTRQIVAELTPTDRELLTINDTLKGGDVLPGFALAVREIFPA